MHSAVHKRAACNFILQDKPALSKVQTDKGRFPVEDLDLKLVVTLLL